MTHYCQPCNKFITSCKHDILYKKLSDEERFKKWKRKTFECTNCKQTFNPVKLYQQFCSDYCESIVKGTYDQNFRNRHFYQCRSCKASIYSSHGYTRSVCDGCRGLRNKLLKQRKVNLQ